MQEVQTLKQDIEALVQRVDSVTSREISLAKTKLEEAGMWLAVELNKYSESKPQEEAATETPAVEATETPAVEAAETTSEPTV